MSEKAQAECGKAVLRMEQQAGEEATRQES
jgi:hypothetical protein